MSNRNSNETEYDNFDEPLCGFHNGALLKGIYDYGFEKPSLIQSKCIKPFIEGRDLIAQSQSGSGKTGAFTIGALMKIKPEIKLPQVIILANTKELATQIKNVVSEIGKYINIKITLCIGGIDSDNRIDIVIKDAENSQILVCTPGRLNGLFNYNKKLFDSVSLLIIDEADQLLSEDFLPQIQTIIGSVPKNTQICLFSATTHTKNIQENKEHFLVNNPIELKLKREEVKVDTIRNYIVDATEEEKKYKILIDLYKGITICQAVIFVNTIEKANSLFKKLQRDNHSVGVIHSNMDDKDRSKTLKNFRKTLTRILVATDIIARGIDVQQVGLVINYDVPSGREFIEKYIHRVGRSGRYGKLGVSINIVTDENDKNDWHKLKAISNHHKIRMAFLPELNEINHFLSGIKGYNFVSNTKETE